MGGLTLTLNVPQQMSSPALQVFLCIFEIKWAVNGVLIDEKFND